MKKTISILFVALFFALFTGCNNYDYSDWTDYEMETFMSFKYPSSWTKDYTADGLLYFYTTDSSGEKKIMVFESKSDANIDTNEEGITESNAYCDKFKSVKILSSSTDSLTIHLTETVSADGNEKTMESILFTETVDPHEKTFKLYFTENVPENIKDQFKKSMAQFD